MSAATNLPPSPALAGTRVSACVPLATEFRGRMGTIGRQSAIYFAGTILTAAAGYFFRIYLARTLGPEALGLYALGMTIVGFLSLFTAFGLPTAAARFVSEYLSKREYERLGAFLRAGAAALLPANLLLGAVLLVVGPWIAKRFYHAPALGGYFLLFSLIMLFGATSTFLGQVMAGYQDVGRRTVITHFLGTPANILFAVALISLGFGLGGYLAAQVASGFLVMALLAVLVWKMTPAEARHTGGIGRMDKAVVSFSAAAFVLTGVQFVLAQADTVVLGLYLHAKQIGIYAVAMALVGFVPVALQSVNQILSPTIAELYAAGKHALLQRLYSTLTRLVVTLTLPLALTFMFVARPLMEIFGPAFAAGAIVLIIGTLGQVINCAVGSVGYLLLMSGHQKQMVQIQITNAVLMIALSLALVPRIGIAGGAVAAAASVAVTNLWALVEVRRHLKFVPYDSSFLKLAVPTLVTGLALRFLRVHWGAHPAWLLAAFAAILAYAVFVATLLLAGVNEEDRLLARAVWDKIAFHPKRGDELE